MGAKTVLVVDDEPELLELVVTYLRKESYRALTADNGADALKRIEQDAVDLVILDVMMEGMDGFHVCERIRQKHSLPVIMLTARGNEADKVRGLKTGADDYMVKPFSPKELMARVEAALRRANMDKIRGRRLVFGELELDQDGRAVTVAGSLISLTRREYELLLFLAENAGRAFSREHLFERVWTDTAASSLRTVDTHIKTLRLKLNGAGRFIETVWGVGYKFGGSE